MKKSTIMEFEKIGTYLGIHSVAGWIGGKIVAETINEDSHWLVNLGKFALAMTISTATARVVSEVVCDKYDELIEEQIDEEIAQEKSNDWWKNYTKEEVAEEATE